MQLEKAQKVWNDVKNDLTKFEETSADLQKKRIIENKHENLVKHETKAYKRTK